MTKHSKAKLPLELILKDYKAGASLHDLARKYKTYPNKILRALKKHTKIRDHSEAQSLVLEQGKVEHPTKGKKRTEEERLQISEGKAEIWQNYSEEERKNITDKARQNWYNIPEERRDEILDAANKGSRKASQDGSKMEKYLYELLIKEGYTVRFHTQVLNTNLEVDLFVVDLNAAIEVNGKSHYETVWGDEHLARQKRSDGRKASILAAKGVKLVKVKYTGSKFTLNVKERLKKKILPFLSTLNNTDILIHEVDIDE